MSQAVPLVYPGLRDASSELYGASGGLQNLLLVEHRWISGAIDGDSPVDERGKSPLTYSQVARVTWNPV